ncbi:MAG: hypothetical protein EXR79_07405 [Myxococcales bacterium]|nr:hypothetical protein [Myxococcales bacterium]
MIGVLKQHGHVSVSLRALVAASLCAGLAACSDDEPVGGPCGKVACPADATSDAGGGDTQDVPVVKPTVAFFVETKDGNVLETASTATVALDADKYPELGVQVDVVVTTTNVPNGTDLQVQIDGVTKATAKAQSNAARLKITLECSTVAPNISVVAKVPGGDASSEIKSIKLDCTDSCLADVKAFTAGCQNTDVDPQTPGLQANFKVTTKSVGCTHARLAVTTTEGAKSDTAKVLLVGGSALITATLTPPSNDEVDGKTATVQAFVSDEDHPGRPSTPSDPLAVSVGTKAPTLTILQPTPDKKNVLKNSDDKDAAAPGIQTVIVGTASTLTTADKNGITAKLDGKDLPAVSLDIDNTFSIPVSFPSSGSYALQITAKNGCGLEKSLSTTYVVFAGQGKMVIADPVGGSVLYAKNDGKPETALTYETTVTVNFQAAPDLSTEVSIFCRKSGPNVAYPPTASGSAKFSDAAATSLAVPVVIDVESLGSAVTCMAKDNAPNPSQSEKDVAVTVALPAPCLKVALPAGDVTLTTASFNVALTTTNLENRDVKAVIAVPGGGAYPALAVGQPKKGLLSTTLALQVGAPAETLPDGAYVITFDATDLLGNVASEQTCSTVKRNFTLDSKGPSVAITLPSKATLTAADDLDSDPKPGYQIDVELTVTSADAASACVYVGGAKVSCQSGLLGKGKVVFEGISLQAGPNAVHATATDTVGNVTKTAVSTITLVSEAPVVTFLQPLGSGSVITDKLTVKVKVAKPNGAAMPGATLDVLVNGAKVAAPVTDVGDGTYSFEISGLSKGSTTLQVGAYLAATPKAIGYSAAIDLGFKNKLPTATITAPTDGSNLNLTAAACLPGVANCVTQVDVATTDAEDDSAVTLTVKCGAASKAVAGVVAAGKAPFTGIVLADQTTCELTAKVVDAANQTATSKVVTIKIDRTAPVFGSLSSPAKGGAATFTLAALDDVNQNPADGMQVNLQVQVSGVSAGTKVVADVFDDNGAKNGSYPATVAADVSDGQIGAVSFGVVTLPDGNKVKIVFATADAAGNPASKTVVATVISKQPEIQFQSPLGIVAKPCTATAECGLGVCAGGTCATPWNADSSKTITVNVIGMPSGALVRLCSDTPGVGKGPCKQAGYNEVVSITKSQNNLIDFDMSALTDGKYHFTAETSDAGTGIDWTSSLGSPSITGKDRTIVLDSIVPVLASLVGPSAADVPAGCLSGKLDAAPDTKAGGTFKFVATLANEDALVFVLVNDAIAATAQSQNKTVTLNVPIPVEGAVTVVAKALDAVGNKGKESAAQTWQVNTTKPAATFAVPATGKATLLAGDPLDIELIADAGTVDVEGKAAVLKDAGVTKATEAFASGATKYPHAKYGVLGDGQHELTAELIDACGNTATVQTTPAVVGVDTKPPVLKIDAPAQGATFADAADAAPAVGGYQVTVQFTTTDAVSWTLELGADCDATFAKCAGYAPVGSGTVTAPGKQEPTILLTVPFGATPNYSARLTAKDSSGNTAKVEQGFAVKLSGCLLSMKGLPQGGAFTTQSCADKGKNCASVAAKVMVEFFGPCGTVTAVQLLKDGKEVASKAPTASVATFDVTVADGAKFSLEGVTVGTAKGSTGAIGVLADLTNPVAQWVAGTVQSVATPGGVSGTVGKPSDTDPATPGHQLHLLLQVTDSGLKGGKVTALQRTVAGGAAADLAQKSVTLPKTFDTAGTATVEVQHATLQENATNIVRATVQDALGNTAEASIAIKADWTPPAAPVLLPLQASDLKPRLPGIALRFTAVGDDGLTGKAASYDVRYVKKTALANETEFKAACDAKALPFAKISTPTDAGGNETIQVDGPDPRVGSDVCKFNPMVDDGITQYAFAIQAVDAAGNRSPVSNVITTKDLRLRYLQVVTKGLFDVPEFRSRAFPVGDLNGDGLADFVAGGGEKAPLCVVYGRKAGADGLLAALTIDSLDGTGYTCFDNKDGGLGATTGRAADMNGDGIGDLVVGNGIGVGKLRSVHVYLGKKAGTLGKTPALIVTGIVNPLPFGVLRMNVTGNFTGAKSAAGLPIDSFGVTTFPTATVTYTRVLIVPGNATLADGKTLTIDIDNATQRKDNNVITLNIKNPVSAPVFGAAIWGLGNLLLDGDGKGTQYEDVGIQQSTSAECVRLVKGRPAAGDQVLEFAQYDTTLPASASAVHVSAGTSATQFGANVIGFQMDAVEFDGDGLVDLVIQQQGGSSFGKTGGIYWLRGSALNKSLGGVAFLLTTPVPGETGLYQVPHGFVADAFVAGLQRFGKVGAAGGGSVDLIHGRPAFFMPGASSIVTIRHGLVRPGAAGASATGTAASYAVADIEFGNPFKPGDPKWGIGSNSWGGVGIAPLDDFTGDGVADAAIGSTDGSLVIMY